MQKSLFVICYCLFLAISVNAQGSDKLFLKEGQVFQLHEELISNNIQTAGAQVINFRMNAELVHKYTVKSVTAINTIVLHHEMQQLKFSFEGMGQKKNFDSNNKEDMNGPFGPYFKDAMMRVYDLIIDSAGTATSFTLDLPYPPQTDEKLITVTDMLKPLILL
jgi:hypothetical protein